MFAVLMPHRTRETPRESYLLDVELAACEEKLLPIQQPIRDWLRNPRLIRSGNQCARQQVALI
jgi:hypothetical protein